MSVKARHDDFPIAVEQQAARWAVKLADRGLTPREKQALETWLAADPQNMACLEQHQELFDQLGTYLPRLAGTKTAPPSIPYSVSWTRLGKYAAGLGVAAALSVLFFSELGQRSLSGTAQTETFITQPGKRQTVILVDGTRVELNAQTRLDFDFGSSLRRARLTCGEAIFSVAKDPSRPFVVETPEQIVRDIGTVFDVRVAEPGHLDLVVLEGAVEVKSSAADPAPSRTGRHPRQKSSAADGVNVPFTLIAGQKLTLSSHEAHVFSLPPTALDDEVAWRRGHVVFDGTPLKEAVAQFARYHGQSIVVSPIVAHLRVGGRFNLDDLGDFTAALELVMPVSAIRQKDGVILITPR